MAMMDTRPLEARVHHGANASYIKFHMVHPDALASFKRAFPAGRAWNSERHFWSITGPGAAARLDEWVRCNPTMPGRRQAPPRTDEQIAAWDAGEPAREARNALTKRALAVGDAMREVGAQVAGQIEPPAGRLVLFACGFNSYVLAVDGSLWLTDGDEDAWRVEGSAVPAMVAELEAIAGEAGSVRVSLVVGRED